MGRTRDSSSSDYSDSDCTCDKCIRKYHCRQQTKCVKNRPEFRKTECKKEKNKCCKYDSTSNYDSDSSNESIKKEECIKDLCKNGKVIVITIN